MYLKQKINKVPKKEAQEYDKFYAPVEFWTNHFYKVFMSELGYTFQYWSQQSIEVNSAIL